MIELEIIGLLGFVALMFLLALRAPIGLAMIIVGIGGTYALSLAQSYIRFDAYLRQFKSLLWENVANYDLSVIPLFILMGYLASHTKLSKDLFEGMSAFFSQIKGGVAMTGIAACAGFGAVCGSSLATASTMSRIALPELKKLNYDDKLSTGSLAAGGTLGVLIPPSIPLVIYAIIVETSIIDMFQAAIIPGTIAVLLFILVIYVQVKLKPSLAPEPTAVSWSTRRKAIIQLLPVGIIFGAIILGLGFGLFTPTPAAGVGVCLILIYGLVMKALKNEEKGLSFAKFKDSIFQTAVTSSMIYFILFGSEVLKTFFTRSNLPSMLADFAINLTINPWLVLVLILVLFILLGCLMDSLSMILVVIPFFWPSLVALNGGDYVSASSAAFGMDNESLKIWFGIVVLVVVELGLITPPVGLNVFVISSVAKDVPMVDIFRGVTPFFLIELFRIALLLGFPMLALALPMWL